MYAANIVVTGGYLTEASAETKVRAPSMMRLRRKMWFDMDGTRMYENLDATWEGDREGGGGLAVLLQEGGQAASVWG